MKAQKLANLAEDVINRTDVGDLAIIETSGEIKYASPRTAFEVMTSVGYLLGELLVDEVGGYERVSKAHIRVLDQQLNELAAAAKRQLRQAAGVRD
jgi:hypothetical protein